MIELIIPPLSPEERRRQIAAAWSIAPRPVPKEDWPDVSDLFDFLYPARTKLVTEK